MAFDFEKGDALVVVDVQNDFTPGGALAVPEGDEIVPLLNEAIDAARKAGIPIVATRDWHPADHISFKDRGGPWPPHCVQKTPGADFHPLLNLPEETHVVSKADAPDEEAYSGFQGTELAEWLREHKVRRLWVGGLAYDYCVKATALDARMEGFEVRLLKPATRAISEETAEEATTELQKSGVEILD